MDFVKLLTRDRLHIGSGSFAQVFDGGNHVIKVPSRGYCGGNWCDYTPKQRARIASAIVQKTMLLRGALGHVIPRTWYGATGFIMQEKVQGKKLYDLDAPHDRQASRDIKKCIEVANEVMKRERDWVDVNESNFFFTDHGTLVSWFDPIAPRWAWA